MYNKFLKIYTMLKDAEKNIRVKCGSQWLRAVTDYIIIYSSQSRAHGKGDL